MEAGDTLDAKLAAETFFLANAKRRETVWAYVERQSGMGDWETEFTDRLCRQVQEGLSEGKRSRRLFGAGARPGGEYPPQFWASARLGTNLCPHRSAKLTLSGRCLQSMRGAK